MPKRTREPGRHPEPGRRGAAAATAGEVRLGPLRSIGTLLREAGHDPAPVLAQCGLDAGALDDPDRRVPFAVAARLVQHAAWATGRADFALLAGQRMKLDDLGLVGELMARARTVGAALGDLQRFFHLQDRGSVAYLRAVEPGIVALGYSIVDPDTPGAGLVYDLVMSIALSILRALAGPRFQATEICLAHVEPPDRAPYRRCFHAPVSFDAAQTELRFAAAWLDEPVAGADLAQHLRLHRSAQSAEADEPPDLVERTRAVIRVLLATGEPTARRVADALGLHERTLRRRLAGADAHLHELVASTRFETARLLLDGTRLPLSAIAAALGYTAVSTFVRAFSSWAGCTPGRWRDRAPGAGSRLQRRRR